MITPKMRQPEVKLSIYDEEGRERQVAVQSKRFTIGRLPENDLAIPDSNLSRRHAVIENFDGTFFISDCGSQNGTAVNHKLVTGAMELRDGDIITLGDAKDVVVHMSNGSAGGAEMSKSAQPSARPSAFSEPSTFAVGPHGPTQPETNAGWNSSAPWLTMPVIATAAVVLIVLFAGLLWAISQRTGSQARQSLSQENSVKRQPVFEENVNRDNPVVAQSNQNDSSPEVSTNVNTGNGSGATMDTSNSGSDELDVVEKYALRVMSSISNDTSPTLSRKALSEIDEKAKRYRGSSALVDELRVMRQRGTQQLAGAAKGSDLKLPLVVFAALAKMDRDGERGDAVAVAQRMMPVLSRLRVTFGTELANDSLLIIAAYDQGPGGATHPLQTTIFELAKRQPDSPATIRTVWYLHEHQKLSPQAYDLILRFLAIGVIAQDPHKFGVDAEPLGF